MKSRRSIPHCNEPEYFDTISEIGHLSLHWRGIDNTAELLYKANLNSNCKVLEIGCGPGETTTALLNAGIDVVAIDSSAKMLDSMMKTCRRRAFRIPRFFHLNAENMSKLSSSQFDIVLLECVFGFIKNKSAALAEVSRVLKNNGCVAITDFHYIKQPPGQLKERLFHHFGINEVLTKQDWIDYFSDFESKLWQEVDLNAKKRLISTCDLTSLQNFCSMEPAAQGQDSVSHKRTRMLKTWSQLALENRYYLKGHNAIWSKIS